MSSSSKSKSTDIRTEVAHEEIARRAHELWEQEGRPEGRHGEHWLAAEAQLRGPGPAPAATASSAAPASTAPATGGNPAYPSLQSREKTVDANTGKKERVKKIPADALKAAKVA